MATYSVVAADGQLYGPADEAMLTQWAREGRIDANTALHAHETNQRIWAKSVPALMPILGLPQGAVNAMLQPQAPGVRGPGMQSPGMQAPLPGMYQPSMQQPGMPQPGYPGAAQPGLQYATPGMAMAGHSLTSFSVVGTVLLTYCTFGIFPWIHFGMMHDKMPKTRSDDPDSTKAILFHLIPFFNLYWHFFERLRLMDRIDEQRRMVGLPPAAPRGFFITASILCIVPIVNYLVALPIPMPIVIGMVQSQVNGLVEATSGAR